jgi:hypothetical protein
MRNPERRMGTAACFFAVVQPASYRLLVPHKCRRKFLWPGFRRQPARAEVNSIAATAGGETVEW